MGKKIRVAVVGGNFGEKHIQGFQQCPEIEVWAICRRQQELAKQLSQRYQIERYYTDFDEMIQSQDIDVVSLAVPNYLHYPMTMSALDHGKHVICEKPLALDLGQAKEMADKAKEKGLIHMIVFNFRFIPAILRMKELIEEGEVGSIHHIFLNWFTSGRRDRESRFFWRFVRSKSGFGALADTGVHGIDLIQWIFGDLKRVISQMSIHVPEHKTEEGKYKKTEVEDSCSFLGETTNGAQVIFHVSSVTPCDRLIRLEVYGEKGILGVYLFSREQDYFGKLLGGRGENSLSRKIPIPERLRRKIPPIDKRINPTTIFFARLAHQLVEAIQTGKTPFPDFFDGVKAQKILQALIISWEKKDWISLV
ncbi:MAG: Gfo/Idh/MocA family protein [Candidatus Hodarchaeota archaeon]